MPILYLGNYTQSKHFITIRYFCRLHTLSSEENTFISLCVQFERLFAQLDPQLYFYFSSLRIHPIDFAGLWIGSAFVGFLNVQETLCLWDRMIGYDNADGLLLFPLLCTAIFIFFRKEIMNAVNITEIQIALGDLSKIKVVPLLQSILFCSDLLKK